MKQVAITGGTITVGGTDLQVLSGTFNWNIEDIEYTPQTGDTVAYAIQIPGGKISGDGSITAAWDSTLQGSGTVPVPLSIDALGTFVFNMGTQSFSGSAKFLNIQITKGDSGVIMYTSNFKTSGTITYA